MGGGGIRTEFWQPQLQRVVNVVQLAGRSGAVRTKSPCGPFPAHPPAGHNPPPATRLGKRRRGSEMGDEAQAGGGARGGGFSILSPKLVNMQAPLHRVLMNFQLREKWTVHFLEADCKTPLWPGRYYDFESVDRLREILVRAAAPPETFEEFDRCVRSWSRGSVYLDLAEEQYGRLKRGHRNGVVGVVRWRHEKETAEGPGARHQGNAAGARLEGRRPGDEAGHAGNLRDHAHIPRWLRGGPVPGRN
jgi:hypothetical protein